MTLPKLLILEVGVIIVFYSRKPTRITNFDYSSDNYYFVTICTHNKECIFGKPKNLNNFGKIAYEQLCCIPEHFAEVSVEYCVVMPNHVHAIISIGCNGVIKQKNADLNVIIGQYKSGVSRKIHQIDPNIEVWQRSFHDHIIRNDAGYQKIAEYIITNPDRWGQDCFYCEI